MVKQGIYRHYKGKYYKVIDVARHSENLEEFVVYKALYGDFGLWIRPREMFFEQVNIDGQNMDRFEFVGEVSDQLLEVIGITLDQF